MPTSDASEDLGTCRAQGRDADIRRVLDRAVPQRWRRHDDGCHCPPDAQIALHEVAQDEGYADDDDTARRRKTEDPTGNRHGPCGTPSVPTLPMSQFASRIQARNVAQAAPVIVIPSRLPVCSQSRPGARCWHALWTCYSQHGILARHNGSDCQAETRTQRGRPHARSARGYRRRLA